MPLKASFDFTTWTIKTGKNQEIATAKLVKSLLSSTSLYT